MIVWSNRRFLLHVILVTAICLALVRQTYVAGLARDMDHAVMSGFSEPNALAVALSDTVYHLNQGYVTYRIVRNRLVEGLYPPGSVEAKTVPGSHDGAVINAAIEDAASLGPLKPGFIDDDTMTSMYYDDLGYVDFIKLAFRLFGRQIESLYSLHFLLLGLSIMAFMATFPTRAAASVVLVAILLQLFLEIDGPVFNPGMPSVYGMRHGSVLALIPGWHLALLLVLQVRPTRRTVLLALLQIAILILAIKIRGSAQWLLLVMLSWFAISALRAYRPATSRIVAAAAAMRAAARWPLVLLFGLVGLSAVLTSAALHPIYMSDDVVPKHGVWHSAYLGLQVSNEVRAITGATGVEDDNAYRAAAAYARQHNYIAEAANLDSPITHERRQGLHDRLIGKVYLAFVAQHPWLVLKLYLVEKPIDLWRNYRAYLAGYPANFWPLCGAVLAMLLGVLWIGPPIEAGERRGILGLLALTAFWSALPIILAYPGASAMVDLMIVWNSAVFVTLTLGAASLAAMLRGAGATQPARARASGG